MKTMLKTIVNLTWNIHYGLDIILSTRPDLTHLTFQPILCSTIVILYYRKGKETGNYRF